MAGSITEVELVQSIWPREADMVEHSPAALCRVRDGRLAQVGFYLDRTEALAAAGKP